MKPSRLFSVNTIQYLLAAIAGVYGVIFIAVVLARIRFPFELEWMEGSFLVQVQRVLDGQPLYTAPTVSYVPLVYTPLYFYLSAAVSRLVGGGFFPLRLVSFLSTLGCLGVVTLWVKKETGRWLPGILAAGLFAACYNLSNTWFDVARVDMLFVFTLLMGAFCLRYARSYRGAILAGVFLSLSFLTKQTALGFIIPLALFAFWSIRRKNALALAATLIVLIGGSVLVFTALSGGWFTHYIFSLPADHAFSLGFALYFLLVDMLPPFIFTWVLVLAWIILPFDRATFRSKILHSKFEIFFTLVLLGGSWAARANVGGDVNTLLPAYAGLALLFGLAAGRLMEAGPATRAKWPGRIPLTGLLVPLACLGQFFMLAYNPAVKIPSVAYLAAGNDLVEAVKAIDGPVFIPAHNYIDLLAGKPAFAHTVPIEEEAGFFGSHPDSAQDPGILNELNQAIADKTFAAIILDNPDVKLLPEGPDGYQISGEYAVLEAADVFFSVSPYKPKTKLNFWVPSP